MASFYRTLLYVFIVFLTIFHQLTNSQDTTDFSSSDTIFDPNEITSTTDSVIATVETSSTVSSSTSSSSSTSTSSSNISTTTAALSDSSTTTSISVDQTTTSILDTTPFSDVSSGPGWWLLVALLITIVIVIIAGVIFYHRQHAPYRRSASCLQWYRQYNFSFLQNWRSHNEDTDNIILQLEPTDVTNEQWPPRISFA